MVPKTTLQRSHLSTSTTSATPELDDSPITTSSKLFIPRDLRLPTRSRKGPPHAKKQEVQRDPKPRNAFILFRCFLLDMDLLPRWIPFTASNIQVSRIAGLVWSSLPVEDKEVFYGLVVKEKREHAKKYPEFKFDEESHSTKSATGPVARKQGQKPSSPDVIACMRIADVILQGFLGEELVVKIQDILLEFSSALSPPKKKLPTAPTSPIRKPKSSISKKNHIQGLPFSLTHGQKTPRHRRATVSSSISTTRDVFMSDTTSSIGERVSFSPSSHSSYAVPSLESAHSASTTSISSRAASPFVSSLPPAQVREFSPFNGFNDGTIPPFDYEKHSPGYSNVFTTFEGPDEFDYSIPSFFDEINSVLPSHNFTTIPRATPEPTQSLTEADISVTIGEEWMEYLNIPEIVGDYSY